MTWRKLLYPLSLPYHFITAVRNWAFNKSILPSRAFEVPVIAIGNLSTGGTGKTPMTEFLIRHFSHKKIGVVSRGYGRKTKGLVVAGPHHSFDEIGDEPYQIFQKFPYLKMALAEKRVEGIEALLKKDPPELILLDDAYQHRYVQPGFQILLTTYSQPFYKDAVLPAGNLRESRRGKSRADVILVTKCPDGLLPAEAETIKRKLKAAEEQSVYFTGLLYGRPLNHMAVELPLPGDGKSQVVLLTGIANPAPLLTHLSERYQVKEHLRYPDHHHFSDKEITELEDLSLKTGMPIITTEKDWVRLKDRLSEQARERIFYLPVEVKVLFGEEGQLLKEISHFMNSPDLPLSE